MKYRLCSCRCFWTGWTNLVASTCAGNGYTSVVIRGRTSAAQLIFSLQLHPQSFRVSVVARRRPTFNLKASVLPRRMKRSFFLEIFRETAEISASKRSAILHQWNDRRIASMTGIISFPRREIFFHIWHQIQKKLEANKSRKEHCDFSYICGGFLKIKFYRLLRYCRLSNIHNSIGNKCAVDELLGFSL